LEKFETVLDFVVFLLSEFAELGHLLTDVVTYAEFALISNNFVVLLILQLLFAKRIIADHLSTGLFMPFNLYQWYYFWAKGTLYIETIYHFLDNARCSSYFDVSVAHGAISVQHKPVLDAKFTKKLVTVVALFRVSRQL
jgi:hypothetical protein